MKKFSLYFFSIILFVFIMSCNSGTWKGYEKVSEQSGIKFITEVDTGIAAGEGQFLLAFVEIKKDADSLIMRNELSEGFFLQIPFQPKEKDSSDFMKMMRLLSAGDSAVIKMRSDIFYAIPSFSSYSPDSVSSATYTELHVKVLQLMNTEQYVTWQNENKIKEEAYAIREFHAYLEQNNINSEPVGSGFYFFIEREGTGKYPTQKDSVTLHFLLMTTKGEELSNTYTNAEPLRYQMGSFILPQGVEEAILKMQIGGKYRVIVPYYLGFGAEGIESIVPPYAHLVYSIELIEINGK